MDQKTEKAIKDSIQHWREVCNSFIYLTPCPKTSGKECALCKEFRSYENSPHYCSPCPLYIAGMHCNTAGSPYLTFTNNRTYENALGMLHALESLLLLPINVGDRVVVVENKNFGTPGYQVGKQGVVLVVNKPYNPIYGYYVEFDDGSHGNFNATELRRIGVSKVQKIQVLVDGKETKVNEEILEKIKKTMEPDEDEVVARIGDVFTVGRAVPKRYMLTQTYEGHFLLVCLTGNDRGVCWNDHVSGQWQGIDRAMVTRKVFKKLLGYEDERIEEILKTKEPR